VLVEQRQGNATITNGNDDNCSNDGRVLGAHLLGAHAEEIINIFALAIRLGLDVTDIKDAILSYPTESSDIGYML
jgi:glutathione reductase (NADPH)